MDILTKSIKIGSVNTPIIELVPALETNVDKIIYKHLTDHDYLDTRPNPNKKKSRSINGFKIFELKAIYNCKLCGFRTMSKNELHLHFCSGTKKVDIQKTVKLPDGYINCPKCNFSPKTENLKLHFGKHIKGIYQNCTNCNTTKNCTNDTFNCPECYFSSKNLTNLKIHMNRHSRGTTYKCMECQHSTNDLKELINHYDQMKDLQCSCGFTTHVKKQMLSHEKKHLKDKLKR